jgi:hypothetical protein
MRVGQLLLSAGYPKITAEDAEIIVASIANVHQRETPSLRFSIVKKAHGYTDSVTRVSGCDGATITVIRFRQRPARSYRQSR